MSTPDLVGPGPEHGTPIMMVRPARFGFDEETAATNVFQSRGSAGPGTTSGGAAQRARTEFDGFVAALRGARVEVIVFEDSPEPAKPGAVFPNNWVSFHGDGTVALYPMATEGRRREVQPGWIERLGDEFGFTVTRVLDWRDEADRGRFLEGTGSLVLDRRRRLAFAALSPRTDLELAQRFASELDYRLVPFRAVDPDGVAIYHTNVLMSVGPTVALVCLEAIPDSAQRKTVAELLTDGTRDVLDLTWEQLCAFAGNVFEIRRSEGRPVLAMSASARGALGEAALEALAPRVKVVSSPLTTIEELGGGSARCMLTAVHLPRRQQLSRG